MSGRGGSRSGPVFEYSPGEYAKKMLLSKVSFPHNADTRLPLADLMIGRLVFNDCQHAL